LLNWLNRPSREYTQFTLWSIDYEEGAAYRSLNDKLSVEKFAIDQEIFRSTIKSQICWTLSWKHVPASLLQVLIRYENSNFIREYVSWWQYQLDLFFSKNTCMCLIVLQTHYSHLSLIWVSKKPLKSWILFFLKVLKSSLRNQWRFNFLFARKLCQVSLR
jgi:hypothetical protein